MKKKSNGHNDIWNENSDFPKCDDKQCDNTQCDNTQSDTECPICYQCINVS